MADTRTIYLHTGAETFSSDPTDTQYKYLDMSDYDSLNPEYQSTIKLSNGVAGIYEDTKAKITLTFKGANSGRDERAEWVNKYAERINKISVSSTNNKGQVFNKSATVSYVEFIDTPYIDGVQVQIEVTMFGRWQSALSIIETVTEKYEGGSKAYLGEYTPDIPNSITNGDFSQDWAGWSQHKSWKITSIPTSPSGKQVAYTQTQDDSLVLELPFVQGKGVVIEFWAMGDLGGQAFHADLWGGEFSIDKVASTSWTKYTLKGVIGGGSQMFIRLVGGGTLFVSDFLVYSTGNLMLGTMNWGKDFDLRAFTRGDIDDDGLTILQGTPAWSGATYRPQLIADRGLWFPEKNYTFSTYVRNTSDTDTIVYPFADLTNISFTPSNTANPIKAHSDWTRLSTTIRFNNQVDLNNPLRWEAGDTVKNGFIQFKGYQLELGDIATNYSQAIDDLQIKQKPHYSYDYRYGKTTLLNQISLPKDKNRFMLAIDSNYTVATITLSAGGKRATISTSRLNTNSSISSDFVAYDITEFVDTDKFLLLTSGLVASVVWDNLASQYAVLYNIMNSVGDTPADISVTTTGGQHIPFKLYTYSVQDFI